MKTKYSADSTMKNPVEKRKHTRFEVILKIDYESPEDFLADYASDASSGGVFIATKKPFKIGDEISFSISFPGLLSHILCRGEVRWRRTPEEATDEKSEGIGVVFIIDSDEEADRVYSLVKKLRSTPSPPEPDEEPVEQPFRVLLAEDNRVVREMIRFAIEKYHGLKIASNRELILHEAVNGKDAWELLQRESFDLVIIDYYMPIMDGMQVIRLIRKNEKICTLPVIAISAGGKDAQEDAYSAGADIFLSKPVVLRQLFETLQRLLSTTVMKTEPSGGPNGKTL